MPTEPTSSPFRETLFKPPRRPEYLLLIAKWKGLLHPAYGYAGGPWLGHAYDLAIWPDEPIVVGRRVRVLAATPTAFHIPGVPPNELDTHDPHVMGRIVEIWRMEDDVATARIVNECEGNMVDEVELHFPLLLRRSGWTKPQGSRQEMTEAEELADSMLRPITCVRPTKMAEECYGQNCWLESNERL